MISYGLLRFPHANSRYFESSKILLENEFVIIMNQLGSPYTVKGYQVLNGLELFVFEVEQRLNEAILSALHKLSSVYVIFQIHDNQLLQSLNEGKRTYFKDDLASILKYSGKTNEDFTKMMINVGVFSSDFAHLHHTPLSVLDPMCGKGTTLYKSLIMGYHSAGIDVDKEAILEIQKYLKRYLKYHLYKHEGNHQTISLSGNKKGTKFNFFTADTKENYKAKDQRVIQFAHGDTREINRFYKKDQFHVFVTDLPYGVQHASTEHKKHLDMAKLLLETAPEWYKVLKKGGVGVIAYNTYHISRAEIEEAFIGAGFKVLSEKPYHDFEHWVEQAVNRDIVVVKKVK